MRIAFLALDDMLVEWMIDGLQETGHEIAPIWLNHLTVPLEVCVERTAPDLIVYAGPAGGVHCPKDEVFLALRKIAPSVLLCFDASDVGWHAMLADYYRKGCFDLIVNCDGCDEWPQEGNTLTSWCPVGLSAFPPSRPLSERSIPFGFCGGHRSDPRYSIVSHLVRTSGLVVKPRDDRYGTYRDYTNFLADCRIVLNIAFSAGGPHGQDKMTKQMKARVVETGFAGACLLETRGSATETVWGFKPGVHFLAYETPQEAADIIKTVSSAFVEKLAANLRAKILEDHSPQKFWDAVFNRAGIDGRTLGH